MTKRTNENDLYQILERQRGTFCQISFVYIFTVIIGFGLIFMLQATLGPLVPVIATLFVVGTTWIFSLLGYFSYIPVREVDKQVATTLKHIIRQAMPEEED